MTNTTPWDELVSMALLGTERENAPSQSCAGKLGNMLEQLKKRPSASKETSLLSASAMIELHRRAGAVATKYEVASGIKPCPQDKLQECNWRAGVLLSSLVEERNTELLFEWMALAREHGKRPPFLVLPRLLELGSYDKSVRALLIDMAGHRARWLASQNQDWSYLLQAEVDNMQAEVDNIDHKTVWETGSTNERVGALRSLRKSDPAGALSLLQSTWSQEPSECRALFVAELLTNLSMSDEEFLEEQGLNDKRKEVREKAQELLVKLPQSRLMQRMIARADPLIKLNRFLLYSELVPSCPETCDQDMIRDGIIVKAAHARINQRADWMMQMMSVIHPDHWCRRFNLTAMKLTTIANNNKDWGRLLLEWWRAAACLHRSQEWAEALIPLLMPDVSGLFECLSGQQREEFFLGALKERGEIRGHGNTEHSLSALLSADHHLSRHCSKILLDQFKKELTVDAQHAYTVYANPAHKLLPRLALSLDVAVAQEGFNGWRAEAMEFPPVRTQLEKFMATLQTRCEIHTELTKS
jgi:hypothetical protein